MTSARVSPTGRRLGLLLLGYLGVVVAVIVFTPFRFAAPSADRLLVAPGAPGAVRDVLLNIVLFVPLGFLLERSGGGRLSILRVVLFGALASIAIEVTQLFLPERWTTATDLVANATGAALGATASATIRRRLGANDNLTGRLFLDLPLLGICWLLLPMLWVEAIQGPLAAQVSLMVAGGLAFAGAARSNAARTRLPARLFWPALLGWSVVAMLPGLAWQPTHTLLAVGAALLAAMVGDQCWRRGAAGNRRGEPVAVFTILMALGPWFVIKGMFDPFHPVASRLFRERILEWLALGAGFTLLGYAMAEWRGRSSVAWPRSALVPIVLAAVIAWPLGRGRVLLIGGAAMVAAFGVLLFELQRAHVIAMRLDNTGQVRGGSVVSRESNIS